jgi:two-component system cell cycle sensor histidine kinase/response regulator CckA
VKAPLRIVLVEDSPTDALLIERALRKANLQCEIVRVDRQQTFEAALECDVDVVLSDYNVPGFDGLKALAILRERYPNIPFILVSGTIGEDLAVQAMRLGASDYLLKDRLSRLAPAIEQAHEQALLQSQKQRLEEQLLRAQRLESVGRLAGGLAHDLNNLLMPILVAQELLARRTHEPDSRHLLAIIETNAQRGADIVKKLLTFARGARAAMSPQQLGPLVAEMGAIMRETFPKDIELHERIDDGAGDAWVRADPTLLHQVLMNLCVNARDAMARGGSLTVSLHRRELDDEARYGQIGAGPGRYVVLTVEDTGSGISSEIRHKIFDPFFTTKEAGKGTGLGLSMVLGIVEQHGGFVSLDSSPTGTRFSVLLPEGSAPSAISVPASLRSGDAGAGELVLLVDDEPTVRHVLRRALEQAGYTVLEAEDGRAALDLYAARGAEIELIVTDVAMPYADGLSLVRGLRACGSSQPVVVMTAGVSSEREAELNAEHVFAVLDKPMNASRLVATVRAALQSAHPLEVP